MSALPAMTRVNELVELAGIYIEDGALRTGADRLRQAADILDAIAREENRLAGMPPAGEAA